MSEIIHFILEASSELGLLGVFLLMTLESCFFPFPSEVVMIPAGYLAFKGEMNLFLVILLGILGSICGSLINYYLAQKLGRPFIIQMGKYFFMTEKKLKMTEDYFFKHGHISTFIGRLIPGIRQLISLPAGLANMPLQSFIFFTGLGAGIWVTILSLLGFFIGENEELIKHNLQMISIILFIFVILLAVFYILYFKKKNDS